MISKMEKASGNAQPERKFSLFSNNTPLFVGFNPKSSESDSSVRSPTSPLDIRVFSILGNSFRSSQRSSHEKIWYRNKVGLSIVDSLDFESKHSGKEIIRTSSNSKNILFGPQLRTKAMDSKTETEVTKSLPKYFANLPYAHTKKESSNVPFELGDSSTSFGSFSFDSRRSSSRISRLSENNSSCLNHDIRTSEIELSEDYTCVRVHGPNPKVTHIFCDCILECNSNYVEKIKEDEKGMIPEASMAYPCSDFLRFCYSCKKNLDGEDIYMYRGEKAFCSNNCRLQVILHDEEMEKSSVNSCDDFSEQKNGNEFSTTSLFIAI